MALELFTVILYLSDGIINFKDPYCHTSFSNDVATFFPFCPSLKNWQYGITFFAP
jgi:hypothetical protein